MPRLTRLALLTVVALATAACSDQADGASIAIKATTAATVPLRAPSGAIYVLTGPREDSANVHVLTPGQPPRQLTDLPPHRGVSWVAASGKRVVVAAAPEFRDHVARLTGNGLVTMDEAPSYTPDLSPDGRLAYTRLTAPSDDQSGQPLVELVVDQGRGTPEVPILRSPEHFSGPVWGPDEAIGVLRDAGSANAEIFLLESNGGSEPVSLRRIPGAAVLAWGRGPLLAVAKVAEVGQPALQMEGLLVNPKTGAATQVLDGWWPLCWHPDERLLLVTDGHRLGLMDPQRPEQVERLAGSSGAPIWAAEWVAARP